MLACHRLFVRICRHEWGSSGSRTRANTKQTVHHFRVVEIIVFKVEAAIIELVGRMRDSGGLGESIGSGLGELDGVVFELFQSIDIQFVEVIVGVFVHCLQSMGMLSRLRPWRGDIRLGCIRG